MQIKLYNSLSNKVEIFTPIVEGKISMYVCGPTVYNYQHIGNARPVVVFDLFKRFFEYVGYEVKFVSNLTDVDDKIINQALLENISEKKITDKYSKAYFKMVEDLNAFKADITPCVTNTMDEIIKFIEILVEKEFAYEINGNVYFRVNKLKSYGVLSNFEKENLLVGARIEENDEKESPLDFTLWKKTDKGISWDSKWSNGRPGWHSECVVMIKDNFGGKIDIHGGGNDLKFPHHENEIAQSVAVDNHQLANYWLHNGMIYMDNEKMSKSLGNLRWAKDLIKEYGGNVIRMNLLSAPYRAPANFSTQTLQNSKKEVDKIIFTMKQANFLLQLEKYQKTNYDKELMLKYLNYLADDLNVANALSVVFETIKKLNVEIRNNNIKEISLLYNTLIEQNKILGLKYEKTRYKQSDFDLYNMWNDLKKEKKYKQADVIREELIKKEII